jgi:hypothetical protein
LDVVVTGKKVGNYKYQLSFCFLGKVIPFADGRKNVKLFLPRRWGASYA